MYNRYKICNQDEFKTSFKKITIAVVIIIIIMIKGLENMIRLRQINNYNMHKNTKRNEDCTRYPG